MRTARTTSKKKPARIPGRRGPLPDPNKRIQISIRLDRTVLAALRQEADDLGLGYQTLISTILTGRKQFEDYKRRWARRRHLLVVRKSSVSKQSATR